MKALKFLREQGFKYLKNVKGAIGGLGGRNRPQRSKYKPPAESSL